MRTLPSYGLLYGQKVRFDGTIIVGWLHGRYDISIA